MTIALPVDRFLATLRIVQREGEHLTYSWRSLFDTSPTIDATWVETLEDGPERAVRLEACPSLAMTAQCCSMRTIVFASMPSSAWASKPTGYRLLLRWPR